MKQLAVLLIMQFLGVSLVCSEVVPSRICEGEEEKSLSEVLEVRISPCTLAGNGTDQVCQVKRGTTASLSVDFVPNEDVKSLRASLYYLAGSLALPFLGLESDGCKSLTVDQCPLESNKKYTWTADVKLSSAYPARTYPLKVWLSEGRFRGQTIACRIFSIELIA